MSSTMLSINHLACLADGLCQIQIIRQIAPMLASGVNASLFN